MATKIDTTTYFGEPVIGWHSAFVVGATGQVAYYHNDCVPQEAMTHDHPVLPLFDSEEEWEWQPVCEFCKLPVLVRLSENALENIGLIPAKG